MNLVLLAFAKRVIIDNQQNTASIIDVVDEITFNGPDGKAPPEGEALPFEGVILTVWERESEDPEGPTFKLEILAPSQGRLLEISYQVNFQDRPRSRVMMKLESFPFVGAGVYSLTVYYLQNGIDMKSEWRITVKAESITATPSSVPEPTGFAS